MLGTGVGAILLIATTLFRLAMVLVVVGAITFAVALVVTLGWHLATSLTGLPIVLCLYAGAVGVRRHVDDRQAE